jgi:hypothetical protein
MKLKPAMINYPEEMNSKLRNSGNEKHIRLFGDNRDNKLL